MTYPLTPEMDRRIKLRLIAGMSFRAVAETCDVSITAVKRRAPQVKHLIARRPCGCGRRIGHKGFCLHKQEISCP